MIKRCLIVLILLLSIQVSAFAENIANEARLEYNKGIDYYKIGQYEKAAEYFRNAINISPDFIDAYYNLGSILEFLKQYDFSNKKVKLFCTNDEGSFGTAELELRSILKGAFIKSGLAIRGVDIYNSDDKLTRWVNK